MQFYSIQVLNLKEVYFMRTYEASLNMSFCCLSGSLSEMVCNCSIKPLLTARCFLLNRLPRPIAIGKECLQKKNPVNAPWKFSIWSNLSLDVSEDVLLVRVLSE